MSWTALAILAMFLDALASLKTMLVIQLLMFSRFQDKRVIQSIPGCYRVLQSVAECYRVLQSVTKCYKVLQSINIAHLPGPIFY